MEVSCGCTLLKPERTRIDLLPIRFNWVGRVWISVWIGIARSGSSVGRKGSNMGMQQSIERGVEKKVDSIKDMAYRQMALQREVQMSVGMAMARDQLQYFGAVWTGLATMGGVARIRTGKFPMPLGIPLTVIGILMVYTGDRAYGTKMTRIVKEAEYIMDHERYRFVPPRKAPFNHVYDDERQQSSDRLAASSRVGEWWPSPITAWLYPEPK